jgi:hypothetical protein
MTKQPDENGNVRVVDSTAQQGGGRTKPLTDEQRRILTAASQGRLVSLVSGRWAIYGEARPDRRSRERLKSRGLIDYPVRGGRPVFDVLIATDLGRDQLAAVSVAAVAEGEGPSQFPVTKSSTTEKEGDET